MPKTDGPVKNVEADSSTLEKVAHSEPFTDPYGDDYRAHRTESFKKILEQLSVPIPENKIKERVGWKDKFGKEHMVSYVEWTTVADILDRVHPNWEYSIDSMLIHGDLMVAKVVLTIDGVSREGVGVGDLTEMGIKGSVSDGLKRAAVLFGVARELYRDDTPESAPTGTKPAPIKPYAETDADLASQAQHGLITRLAKEKGVDAGAECKKVFKGAALPEISKKAASWLIDHLQNYQAEETKAEAPPAKPAAKVDSTEPVTPETKKQIWDSAKIYYKGDDGQVNEADAAAGIEILFKRLFGKEHDIKKMTEVQGAKLLENLVDKIRANERA